MKKPTAIYCTSEKKLKKIIKKNTPTIKIKIKIDSRRGRFG